MNPNTPCPRGCPLVAGWNIFLYSYLLYVWRIVCVFVCVLTTLSNMLYVVLFMWHCSSLLLINTLCNIVNNVKRWIHIKNTVFLCSGWFCVCATETTLALWGLVRQPDRAFNVFLRNLFSFVFPLRGLLRGNRSSTRAKLTLLVSATPSSTIKPLWIVYLWQNIKQWFCGTFFLRSLKEQSLL